MRALVFIVVLMAFPAQAESYRIAQEKRPHLFHADTGFRLERYRAPTPDDIPAPARVADVKTAAQLLTGGAVAIDVYGATNGRFDELDGTWIGEAPRETLPGAVWLPEVGRGRIGADIARFLEARLAALTGGDPERPILVFCSADCWMSWNAAQRVAALGYAQVWWYPLGVEGWAETGRALAPVAPDPVPVD